ncbi:MAG: choice-of-anchor Q domain-containing protein [Pyrinomonadaceae bacterium]
MKTTVFFRRFSTIAILILTGAAMNAARAATFTVTNTNDSGAGSLRQAVLSSNTTAGSDTIVFDSSFGTPKTITLAATITIDPATGDSLTINGPGANLLTVSGNNAVQIFFVNTGDTASVSGMTLTQGRNNNGGAAFDNRGTLSVANMVFASNFGNNGGGAITTLGTLTVSNSTFNSNSTSFDGGAIAGDSASTVTVSNSTFTNNTASYGGAIAGNGGVSVTGCTFSNNSSISSNGGGAIYYSNSSPGSTLTAAIANSTFTNNAETVGSGGGGAIRHRTGSMAITNSIFTNNTTIASGGAVESTDLITISGSTFTGNSATGANAQQSGQGSGGAIGVQTGGQLTITNSFINGNFATNSGGGIYNATGDIPPPLTVINTTISNNVCNTDADGLNDQSGGGIFSSSVVVITGSTISGNRAKLGGTTQNQGNGGGIYGLRKITMDNSTISGNVAESQGGGIYDAYPGGANSEVVITNSTIVYNSAANGGGIRSSNSVGDTPTSLRNTIVALNSPNDILNPFGSAGFNLISVDPLLAPLAFNGGSTRTHALRLGSPAIDAGDPTTFPATDQRGITRPQDGDGNGSARSDIGAYERRQTDYTLSAFADFDGDGRSDISVFRPSTGIWYVQQSTAGFTGVSFGQIGDLITPADFDGDGKTDVAVFRPSNGVWYLLRSSLGFTGVAFGQAGDIPVPADYDGDGRADIAVFRPSNGYWYLQRSSLGFTGIAFGADGDKPAPNAFVR